MAATTEASTGWVERTPRVDWTVSAVMHVVAKRPWAAKVFRSAVTPAPEDGSKPAMLRRICMSDELEAEAKNGLKSGFRKIVRFFQFRGSQAASYNFELKCGVFGGYFTVAKFDLL